MKTCVSVGVFVAVIALAAAQESFKCPDDYGFYPHSRSCDKYFKCDNGVAELKTCGNGLAFDASDPKYLTENCDYIHNVECGDRTTLEPPISAPHCPRLYGIFPDETKCDVFWNCWNGEASRYQCSPGLGYDPQARVCMWADQVPECRVDEVAGGFSNCPAAGELVNSGSFSRHPHPEDCRKYYVCMEGSAREYGCPIGTVFKIGDSDGTGNCEDPEDVPGCEDYYGEVDLKALRKLGLRK
ncbi:protein obstructor-E isoform X2 [Anabrus simplex]|uniref:protein obstructor-E isoform X2 n=1 Tax=Anabrus simplex TaxID=316456 RepID=UPI0035A28284